MMVSMHKVTIMIHDEYPYSKTDNNGDQSL
jgi:hypothetical protein